MNRSDSLVKNTFILAFGSFCTKVLTFVMVPLFSRWLTTEQYGDFDLLCTYITLLLPIITLSCGEALFRKILGEESLEKQKRLFSTCLFIVTYGVALMVMAAVLFFRLYRHESALVFIFLAIMETANNFLQYYVRGKKKLKTYTIANIAFVVTMSIATTVLILVLDLGLNGLLIGYAIGYFVSSLAMIVATKAWQDFGKGYISVTSFKEIVSYSAPLIPNSISWWIANVSDRTIVNIFIGSAANGIYAIANKIPSICTSLFSVFHLSWQQTAVESINDTDKQAYFNSVYNRTNKVLVSICTVILSTNIILFEFVFDQKYDTAQYHVPILMTAIIFSFLAQFIGGIFIGFQDTKINGATTVIAAVLNIIIHLALIKYIGLYAASISTLVSYVVLYFIRIIVIQKYVKIKIDRQTVLSWVVYSACLVVQYSGISLLKYIFIVISASFFVMTNKELVFRYAKKLINIRH